LSGVLDVLIVASAALAEVGATWLYAVLRCRQDLKERSFSEAVPLFKDAGFDELSWQCEGYKHSSAGMFAFDLTGESRAAVDHLFDL
jgi:hypothetical protein